MATPVSFITFQRIMLSHNDVRLPYNFLITVYPSSRRLHTSHRYGYYQLGYDRVPSLHFTLK